MATIFEENDLEVDVEGTIEGQEELTRIYGDLSKVTVRNGKVITIVGEIKEIFISMGVENGYGVKVVHKDKTADVYLAKDSSRLYQDGPDGRKVEKPLPMGSRVEAVLQGEGGSY